MAKESDKVPTLVRPYECHGCGMVHATDDQWCGDCPFCGKTQHLYVSEETGMFDCKVCGAEGNVITFLEQYADLVAKETSAADYKKLGQVLGTVKVNGKVRKKNIPASVFKSFGIGWSGTEWLIPARGGKKNLVYDLRRFNGKIIASTWGCKTQLGGLEQLKSLKSSRPIWICEGEKDAIALRWLLKMNKRADAVLWVPGAQIFKQAWSKHFSNANIILAYDNDDPGKKGVASAKRKLTGRTSSLRHVVWPAGLPDGFDIRDFVISKLAGGQTPTAVLKQLTQLANNSVKSVLDRSKKQTTTKQDTPDADDDTGDENIDDDKPGFKVQIQAELSTDLGRSINPKTFDDLVQIMRDINIEMDDDTTLAFKLMLAVCLSNDMPPGDPIWLYIVGQSGRGKTLLLNALEGSTRTVFRSNVTPHSLVSGWNEKGGDDPSLLRHLSGKTFVIKDFTEVLTMPAMQQDEIFSTLRGAYDGMIDRSFGNGVKRHYSMHSDPPFYGFSVLAGVTDAIHGHRKASLGERFMKFQMRPASHRQEESVIERAIANVGLEAGMQVTAQIAVAKFLTRTLESGRPAAVPTGLVKRIQALVQLVAVLRAQVDRDWRTDEISFRPVPEMGTRLAKQLVKLGMVLAVVENKKEIDNDIYDILERVAFNTAYGFHLDIVAAILKNDNSADVSHIVEHTKLTKQTVLRRLEDLQMLKLISLKGVGKSGYLGGRPGKLYEVNKRIAQLWSKTQTGVEACKTTKKKPKKSSYLSPKSQKSSQTSRSKRSKNSTKESRAPRRLSWS